MTTITSKTTIPAPEYHDRTISTASTDTRTLSTTSLLLTGHSTAPDTTIHHMKIEDTGFYKNNLL